MLLDQEYTTNGVQNCRVASNLYIICDINLLPGSSTGHVTFLASNHRVLGACLALISCFSYAIWIIIQYRIDELNGFLPIDYICIVCGEGLDTMKARLGH
ncbi:hypothetical protein YC2023_059035 [Brassica napus]